MWSDILAVAAMFSVVVNDMKRNATAAVKALSAGLIAAAVLATPATAREVSNRNAAAENARAAGRVDGHVGNAIARRSRQGGSCDVGDNPHLC